MAGKRVLSLGQCGADHGSLTRTIGLNFHAEVVDAATAEEALDQLRQGDFALLLVNRVFDADGASGVEFIKLLKGVKDLQAIPVMLVSNHEDAQGEAQAAGAVPGFGKAALSQPRTIARLKEFLG